VGRPGTLPGIVDPYPADCPAGCRVPRLQAQPKPC
jgi:hypothetical protein